MKSLKFKLFIIAFFGIYLAIIISNIIKKEKLKEEYTLELLNFGEILTDIEIYDKRGLTRKGRVYKKYFYKFFIEGKGYRGIIEIPQKENNPNFVIGNPLTILYSERDPEIILF